MAANCASALTNPNTTITQIQSGVTYSGTISNPFDGDFFEYQMLGIETMTFTVGIDSGGLPQDGILNLYIYDSSGNTVTQLGSSYLQRATQVFDYDGQQETYRFCITYAGVNGGSTPFSYTLKVDFTEYDFVLLGECNAYAGEYIPSFALPEIIQDCTKPVAYEWLDGILPTGLTITNNRIEGVLPEMDCEEITRWANASFSWFKQDKLTGNWVPTTFDYYFTMKAFFPDDPSGGVERIFAICVVNDWDKDRDGFIEAEPNFIKDNYVEEIDYVVFENVEEEEVEEPQPQLEQITEEILSGLGCDCQVLPEYQGLVSINTNELCDCPEEVEELIDPETVVFDDLCEPCEEELPAGLVAIPKSLCPCDIEPEIVAPKTEYILGDIEDCLGDYVNQMFTAKACSPHDCTVKEPGYPTPYKEVFKFPNLCNICED